jgi:hypothetical protein
MFTDEHQQRVYQKQTRKNMQTRLIQNAVEFNIYAPTLAQQLTAVTMPLDQSNKLCLNFISQEIHV